LDEAAAQGIKVSDEEVSKEIDAIKMSVGEQFNKTLKVKELTLDAFRNRTREKMIMKTFIENLVGEDSVNEDEIREFYVDSQKSFIKPPRVFMSMIEFDTEAEALAAAEDMWKNKMDFDVMAKKISSKRKTAVMDYGWVSPDFFSPSLANAINNIKDGNYGGPYKAKRLLPDKGKEREQGRTSLIRSRGQYQKCPAVPKKTGSRRSSG
jgi:parvulin-like peptidyl-prolyl isomerase